MSEKAACPRCDGYSSEVYYDGQHRWCGWNCAVEYKIDAYGPTGHAHVVVREKPSADLRASVAALVGAGDTSVWVDVAGYRIEGPFSAWIDPDQPDPKPLSERKAKANLKALRDLRLENAMRDIDADLGV